MAYEWLYGNTESRKSLSASKQALSQELAAQFPSYINSLGLKKADGTALDADNYLDYIKQILIKSAQEAKDAGADIPDSVGVSFSSMAARLSASKASRISQIFSNFWRSVDTVLRV